VIFVKATEVKYTLLTRTMVIAFRATHSLFLLIINERFGDIARADFLPLCQRCSLTTLSFLPILFNFGVSVILSGLELWSLLFDANLLTTMVAGENTLVNADWSQVPSPNTWCPW
jgi:hypothetical protein